MAVAIKQAEILTVIVETLKADADVLAALVKWGAPGITASEHIRNHIPQDWPLPYLRVSLESNGEWDNKSTTGYEGITRIDVWTDHHGDLAVHELIDAIMNALQNASLALTDAQMVLFRHQNSITTIEPDGQTHRGIVRFRYLAAET